MGSEMCIRDRPNGRRRQGGRAVRVLAGSFHGSPEFKLSATLVNGLPLGSAVGA